MLTGCYLKNKKQLSKMGCKRYQNLSEEKQDKKHQHAHEQYRNLSEENEKKCQYGHERQKDFQRMINKGHFSL